jgi:cold-inducible RNA-binding protein
MWCVQIETTSKTEGIKMSLFNAVKRIFMPHKKESNDMNTKLYVGNVSWNATEGDLENEFARFGEVTEAKIVLDKETNRSRGFAFVTFKDEASAQLAIKQLDGTPFMGRDLRVSQAENRKPQGYKPRESGSSYGQARGGYR